MKKSLFLSFSIVAILGSASLTSHELLNSSNTAQVNDQDKTLSKIASFRKDLKSFTRGNANLIRNMILFTIPVAALAYNPETKFRGILELMRLWFGGYMLFETTPNTPARQRILLYLYKFFILTYAGRHLSAADNYEFDQLILAGAFARNMYECTDATATLLDELLQ